MLSQFSAISPTRQYCPLRELQRTRRALALLQLEVNVLRLQDFAAVRSVFDVEPVRAWRKPFGADGACQGDRLPGRKNARAVDEGAAGGVALAVTRDPRGHGGNVGDFPQPLDPVLTRTVALAQGRTELPIGRVLQAVLDTDRIAGLEWAFADLHIGQLQGLGQRVHGLGTGGSRRAPELGELLLEPGQLLPNRLVLGFQFQDSGAQLLVWAVGSLRHDGGG